MEGVQFLTNEKNERIAVQIDLKSLGKHRMEIEDFLDAIVAQSRVGEETVTWETAKKELKEAGKL